MPGPQGREFSVRFYGRRRRCRRHGHGSGVVLELDLVVAEEPVDVGGLGVVEAGVLLVGVGGSAFGVEEVIGGDGEAEHLRHPLGHVGGGDGDDAVAWNNVAGQGGGGEDGAGGAELAGEGIENRAVDGG